MQISGTGNQAAAAIAQQQADIVALTKLTRAVDAMEVSQGAVNAVADPDPSKGGEVDTYA